MFEGADEALARVREDVARVQERASRLGELRRGVESVQVTVVSSGRDMAVTVDSSGVLTDLQLRDEALRWGGRDLAAEILRLCGEARRQVQVQVAERARDVLGDDPLAQRIVESVTGSETPR